MLIGDVNSFLDEVSLCALLFNHSVPNEQQGPVGQISCVVSVCSL